MQAVVEAVAPTLPLPVRLPVGQLLIVGEGLGGLLCVLVGVTLAQGVPEAAMEALALLLTVGDTEVLPLALAEALTESVPVAERQ